LTWWSDIPAVLNGATQGAVVWADCREFLPFLPDACIDAIVTDPPYGLEFMGKEWDHGVPGVEFWRQFLRVAKPGCHLLAFGGTRTYHRLACAIEDAGWEIRDCLMWLYGQGFPKSLDVGKAIDKAKGVERRRIGTYASHRSNRDAHENGKYSGELHTSGAITAPATPEAAQWDGWGTALKPAWEPILVARKPPDGTVAANVLEHGTGGLNIDGCRIACAHNPSVDRRATARRTGNAPTQHGIRGDARKAREATGRWCDERKPEDYAADHPAEHLGRWPANVVLTHHPECGETCHPDCPVRLLDEESGISTSGVAGRRTGQNGAGNWGYAATNQPWGGYADSGGASRFFYCAKASPSERTAHGQVDNRHPTVKPLALMQWLVRLVCPPGGIVLDPFCGSGSTLIAARREGVRYLGIDNDPASTRTARERLAAETPLFERKADAARASQRRAASQSSNERG